SAPVVGPGFGQDEFSRLCALGVCRTDTIVVLRSLVGGLQATAARPDFICADDLSPGSFAQPADDARPIATVTLPLQACEDPLSRRQRTPASLIRAHVDERGFALWLAQRT